MRCDLYAITLSIITGVTTSPISDLIERTIVDENSILSIPSPAGAHEMFDMIERRTASSNGGSDKVRLDCNVQRKKSLLKKTNGDVAIYVPTCSPTDSVFYLPVQCLEVQKYCWCVHTTTGEPIPGTAILNAKPHCEEEKPTPKPKKKRRNRCTDRRRIRFIRRLIASIKAEMIITGSAASENVGRDAALTWKFNQLNTNKNQVLERSEWKPYKSALLQWKKVKHCSRSFFKTCDADSNRRLTFDEWKKCIVADITKTPALRPDQLNPFLYILKAD
ncbi:hypothetical protein Y032_0363g3523 [Ancylostoma ceylanicum]|uniref:Thyroglobulin type-1 domain-containing protein n=1 Tax=Ancylostoma ceylanicum TaxID=53326 RepID=A0A016RVC0_9BILA|nr:hypothetical protein Y032_0363g3523 [Ancylostoma ceylanicum]